MGKANPWKDITIETRLDMKNLGSIVRAKMNDDRLNQKGSVDTTRRLFSNR